MGLGARVYASEEVDNPGPIWRSIYVFPARTNSMHVGRQHCSGENDAVFEIRSLGVGTSSVSTADLSLFHRCSTSSSNHRLSHSRIDPSCSRRVCDKDSHCELCMSNGVRLIHFGGEHLLVL
jgi:hypothetical protein